MRALVKAKQEPGPVAGGRAGAHRRPQRRAGEGAEDRHLRHRHPHLQLGRVEPAHHPRADAHRPRVRGRGGGGRQRGDRASSRAIASPARATSPAATAATAAPASATCAATPWAWASTAPGCFAEYVALPAFNVFRVPEEIPDEIASLLRSAGQRGAHRPVLRPGGRGRADHRRRPHRRDGGGHRQARRRAPRRRHRRQRRTGWSWPRSWAPPASSTWPTSRSTR